MLCRCVFYSQCCYCTHMLSIMSLLPEENIPSTSTSWWVNKKSEWLTDIWWVAVINMLLLKSPGGFSALLISALLMSGVMKPHAGGPQVTDVHRTSLSVHVEEDQPLSLHWNQFSLSPSVTSQSINSSYRLSSHYNQLINLICPTMTSSFMASTISSPSFLSHYDH